MLSTLPTLSWRMRDARGRKPNSQAISIFYWSAAATHLGLWTRLAQSRDGGATPSGVRGAGDLLGLHTRCGKRLGSETRSGCLRGASGVCMTAHCRPGPIRANRCLSVVSMRARERAPGPDATGNRCGIQSTRCRKTHSVRDLPVSYRYWPFF